MHAEPKARVLYLGTEDGSWKSREEALCMAGFAVDSVTCTVEASAQLNHNHYDVLLVGLRVEEEERDLIAALFKRKNRGGKIVFLYYGSIRKAEIANAVLNVQNDPADLARLIWEQLHGC